VPINQLTHDALDSVAKIPEYKVCAVRVEKVFAHETPEGMEQHLEEVMA
jgi:hypothetical protein